jgi:hypothetical protein
MRIREENCNLVLLAGVTLVSTMIAGGAALLEPASATGKSKPFYIAVAATSPSTVAATSPSTAAATSPSTAAATSPSASAAATAPAAANKPARLVDDTPVRVVGAPFVPNTNPRER